METKFDLQHAVKQYVSSIYNQGSLSTSDAQELETHMHDAAEALCRQGLNEEEAFLIAKRRLGNQQLLTTEYAKVNPSLKTNQLWAHLILGFNILTGFFGLGQCLLILIYGSVIKFLGLNTWTTVMVCMFHMLLSTVIILSISYKATIAAFIEQRLRLAPLKTVLWSFVLPVFVFLFSRIQMKTVFKDVTVFPKYELRDHYIEFTFYLILFCLFLAVINLVFTVQHPERGRWKHILERPSIIFLLILGCSTELLAASSRIFGGDGGPVIAGLCFGLVYFFGSLAISYYNPLKTFTYLCWYAALGFLLELGFGINADLNRLDSGSVMTPYFVSGLILGVLVGFYTGKALRKRGATSV